MEAIREKNIWLDIAKKEYKTVSLKQLDSTKLIFLIMENGVIRNCSDNSFVLNFRKGDNTIVIQTESFNTSSAAEGKISVMLDEDCVRAPGEGALELQIYKSGKKVSSFSLDCNIDASITYNAISSQNKVTLIETLEGKIQEGIVTRDELNAWVEDHHDIVDLDNRVTQNTSQLEENTKKITNITPENFVGVNGVIDDTQAILESFQYAVENKMEIQSKGERVYLITEPISVSNELLLNFKNATIKAIAPMDFMLTIDSQNELYGGIIRNLRLDCNNLAKNGLYNKTGKKDIIDNVEVLDAIELGFKFGNIHEGSYKNLRPIRCGTAIEVNGSDMHFTDVYPRDCKVGIVNKGGVNFYTRVHAWLSEAFEGSVFADIQAPAVFTDCYPDTYETGYFVRDWVTLFIKGGFAFWNTAYMPTTIHPVLFKYMDSNYSKSTKISNFYGLNSNTSLSVSFSNYTFQGYVASDSSFFSINNVPSGKTSQVTLASGWEATKNVLVKKDNRVIMDLVLTSASKTISFSDVYIGYVSEEYYPTSPHKFMIAYGKQDNQISGYIYGYFSGGNFNIHKMLDGVDISPPYYLYIHLVYDTNFN